MFFERLFNRENKAPMAPEGGKESAKTKEVREKITNAKNLGEVALAFSQLDPQETFTVPKKAVATPEMIKSDIMQVFEALTEGATSYNKEHYEENFGDKVASKMNLAVERLRNWPTISAAIEKFTGMHEPNEMVEIDTTEAGNWAQLFAALEANKTSADAPTAKDGQPINWGQEIGNVYKTVKQAFGGELTREDLKKITPTGKVQEKVIDFLGGPDFVFDNLITKKKNA